MKVCVGRIPFLVCAPFFHDFLGKESEFQDIDFVDGAPRMHCAGLKDGSVHLSPTSSITFAQKPQAFVLSGELCTSCGFEVRSVKLFSKYPIEELSGKTIRMTTQSMTSVTLLRILLEDRFSLSPVYVSGCPALPDDDACLLIGDQALEENERHRFAFGYDLGTLWQAWQGVPFVFGAWVISKEALLHGARLSIERYMELTHESIEHFRMDKVGSLDKWLAKYPVNLPRHVVNAYYDVLDYRFTEQRKESLKLFFEYARRHGLVDAAPPLEFL